MKMQQAKPFVKWAGGKTQLLHEVEKLLPDWISLSKKVTYVEPFIGGGAVLFWLLQKYPNIKRAIINDINKDLIGVYKTIKQNPEELISLLYSIQQDYISKNENDRKDYFLQQRDRFNSKDNDIVFNSALFIFLNRTCFNGLYRVNSKGQFNVPHGKYANPKICDKENIFACHEILRKVEISDGDFEKTIQYAGKDTIYYLDPPYKPISLTSSFTAYSKESFDDKDQIRLSKFCDSISEKGSVFILSNSDVNSHEQKNLFFDDLYSSYQIYRVSATRMISANASNRGTLNELMVSNNVNNLSYKYK
ncbi:MAG: DNA adenine methylase [Bacteroidales bacterium]|nr:DNA adenine methylase [Bacteroidales bacterium]